MILTQTTMLSAYSCRLLNYSTQGPKKWYVMHNHVWDSQHAKFDDDDLNSFPGIACEGHTDRQGLVYRKLLQTNRKGVTWLWKQKRRAGAHKLLAVSPSTNVHSCNFWSISAAWLSCWASLGKLWAYGSVPVRPAQCSECSWKTKQQLSLTHSP